MIERHTNMSINVICWLKLVSDSQVRMLILKTVLCLHGKVGTSISNFRRGIIFFSQEIEILVLASARNLYVINI